MWGGNAAAGAPFNNEKHPGRHLVQGKTASAEQRNREQRLLQQLTRAGTSPALEYLSCVTNAVKNYNLMQP